jgi:hypothetical protein
MQTRPQNYTQGLWKVNDTELYKPGERFISNHSPYLESYLEGSSGPLEGAPVPKGLVSFIEDITRAFHVIPSRYTVPQDVAARVMSFFDFTEPYYLFVDSLIQVTSNQLRYTYRVKQTGSVLKPDELECFGVARNHEFRHYQLASQLMAHPTTKEVLEGRFVQHPERKDAITRTDILEKLCKILYGDRDFLASPIEDWVHGHFEEVRYGLQSDTRRETFDEVFDLDRLQQQDELYWEVATLGALMWFRSKFAIRFLAEYHPVYSHLLTWDPKQERVCVIPESGGEVIVEGWNIYTREHLTVEENKPPGTCECCKLPLHCTKYINAQALFHPICSCGALVPVEDTGFHGHGYEKPCTTYLKKAAPFAAFVCQKCIQVAVDRHPNPQQARCQRTSCPATQCPHHAGRNAYIAELSKRRTQLLTVRH